MELPFISIHAPVKGATRYKVKPYTKSDYFNPRSCEGSDQLLSGHYAVGILFQSTLP